MERVREMKKENINNDILDDLNKRNDNWDKLEGVPERVDVLETDATALELRVGKNETDIAGLETNKQETKVKISSVEKELNTLKSININSNQEATQVAQGHGVVNLPKTAGEGHADFGIKGLTATNLVENGDFSDDVIINFPAISTARELVIKTSNGLKTTLKTSSGNSGFYIRGISLNASKYYIGVNVSEINVTGEPNLQFRVIQDEYTKVLNLKLKLGLLSSVFQLSKKPSIDSYITIDGVGQEIGANYTIKDLKIINLTQTFGAGNEPTKEQCDVIFSNYFEGTQSVQGAMRVKSVSLDKSKESLSYLNAKQPLRSLPNGVSDEITSDGMLIKRVSDLGVALATPITTPIQTSGSLIAYPSGTVYVENIVADAGMYTTKMNILNTELPIKKLDKLSKVDYTTGLEHSLDVSKAVVTAQSFTHPDLTMGDIVFFEYYYDLESTNGNASVKYYDSRYTVKDSVTNKVYKWSITIANGVPTITTVEV